MDVCDGGSTRSTGINGRAVTIHCRRYICVSKAGRVTVRLPSTANVGAHHRCALNCKLIIDCQCRLAHQLLVQSLGLGLKRNILVLERLLQALIVAGGLTPATKVAEQRHDSAMNILTAANFLFYAQPT